jgi:D-alanyl-D-alanine carboxypeptidase (penicillin-binding protein 5/6)
MKTGHTDEAGYCLDATALRNGRPLIAVVLGSSTRKASAEAAEALLDYGYHFFETHLAYKAGQVLKTVKNIQATPAQITLGAAADVWVTVPRGHYAMLKPTVDIPVNMPLPLKQGQVVGRLILSDDTHVISIVPLVALVSVERAGWFVRQWHSIKSTLGIM